MLGWKFTPSMFWFFSSSTRKKFSAAFRCYLLIGRSDINRCNFRHSVVCKSITASAFWKGQKWRNRSRQNDYGLSNAIWWEKSQISASAVHFFRWREVLLDKMTIKWGFFSLFHPFTIHPSNRRSRFSILNLNGYYSIHIFNCSKTIRALISRISSQDDT